jgi:hypothetical protein
MSFSRQEHDNQGRRGEMKQSPLTVCLARYLQAMPDLATIIASFGLQKRLRVELYLVRGEAGPEET